MTTSRRETARRHNFTLTAKFPPFIPHHSSEAGQSNGVFHKSGQRQRQQRLPVLRRCPEQDSPRVLTGGVISHTFVGDTVVRPRSRTTSFGLVRLRSPTIVKEMLLC
jgi:hypothetical protein